MRRLVVLLCLVAIVLAAVTPAASAHLADVLVEVWPLFGLVAIASLVLPDAPLCLASPVTTPVSSRPPPLA